MVTHGPRAQNSLRGNLLIMRSDPGNDLDPCFVHPLEPLSLLLGILVWDGVDRVVASAVLSIVLGRCALRFDQLDLFEPEG